MRGGFVPNFGSHEYKKPELTPRQRREFAMMLRTVNTLMGDRPALLGDETVDEMLTLERAHKQKRQLQKRRLSTIIDALGRMVKRHPELKKEFAAELKEIGL